MEKPILSAEAVEALLAWYAQSKRDLPWRRTRDPYCIWISEIMLQQTRVEAVKPYYARFLSVCPTVKALAELPEEQLLKLWEGLGYYSRARNLQKAARAVLAEHEGSMPADYRALLKLPGIGEYTAGAIASIAFGIPAPAVDGNVLRVLARVQGSCEDVMRADVKVRWREALSRIIPQDAGSFTQSLIELGATVCVPNGEPKCHACPLLPVCEAAKQGIADALPVRGKKKPRRIEERTVLILRDGDRTVLRKRPPKGLLAGLFELPHVQGHLPEEEIPSLVRSLGFEPLRVERLEDAKHIFSHIEWHMIAYSVRIAPEFDGWHKESGMQIVPNEELQKSYAIPSAFAAYKKHL